MHANVRARPITRKETPNADGTDRERLRSSGSAPLPTPTHGSATLDRGVSFDERLGMLVDAEQLTRDNRALTRRLKEAKPD